MPHLLPNLTGAWRIVVRIGSTLALTALMADALYWLVPRSRPWYQQYEASFLGFATAMFMFLP